jgi:putative lipoprotein
MDGRSIVSTDGNFSVEFSPADGKISGKGDCNRVSGMYKTDSTGKLTVTGLVSTRAFCNNQADEDAFVKHLSNADTYAIDHKTLILFADGQIVMMFSRK